MDAGPPSLGILIVEETTRLRSDAWAPIERAGLAAEAVPGVACGVLLLKHFPHAKIVCLPTPPGCERQAWDLAAYVRFKVPRIGIVLPGDGAMLPDLRFSPVASVCTCQADDRNLPGLLRALMMERN